MVARLAMWSGPRNISTALMRSWENRPDSVVVDEPLYAHFLAETGIDHPGRDEVVAMGETDWRVVVRGLLAPLPEGVNVFYQKHMTHHLLPDVDRDWIAGLTNVLLIRDPRKVLSSYVKSREQVELADLGLEQQVDLFVTLSKNGIAPLVIDAADFLSAPEPFLHRLCDLIEVPFDERMLSWPPGPRAADGVWGPYWYDSVWKSTGFAPYVETDVLLSEPLESLADDCRPLYERLHRARWTP
jgi:hypothetical protein